MRSLSTLILSLLLINVSCFSQEKVVPSGTEVYLKSKAPVALSGLYVGKDIPFIVSRDVKVNEAVVVRAGTELRGNVITGNGGFIIGMPEVLFVQFNEVCDGTVCLPLMKSIKFQGSSRAGWAWGLALPTLALSLFIVGGKVKNLEKKEVAIETVAPVAFNL